MRSIRPSSRSEAARAFTLIEVLLGVLILALGLLGLAAVFPLVVKQQREAQDVVVGLSAARGAESVLRGHFDLNSRAITGARGFAAFATALSTGSVTRQPDGTVLWSQLLADSSPVRTARDLPVPGFPRTTEALRIGGSDQFSEVNIPILDRLLPLGAASPTFVWDAAVNLASPIVGTPPSGFVPSLRITVFVRRIDSAIRLPVNTTLQEAIRTGQRQPVALDPATRVPTLNGEGVYARFFFPEVSGVYERFQTTRSSTDAVGAPFSVVEFGQNTAESILAAVRQVDQQLVDVEGNVYTVVGLPDESGVGYASARSVVIAPPISRAMGVRINSGQPFELLLTPQIPAAVNTFVVRP